MQERKSVYLDFLRGTSSLLVVVGHFRYLIFAKAPGILPSSVLFLTGLARQAVVVFFVLSGYLIGGETAYIRLLEQASLLSQPYPANRPTFAWGNPYHLAGGHDYTALLARHDRQRKRDRTNCTERTGSADDFRPDS